jgi:hypothetical protein
MALSQGVQKKRKLWTEAGRSELEKLELLPYAAERRKQLLQALDGYDAELGRFYRRLAVRKQRALAKVAVARKLAVRLYLKLREDWTYAQLCRAVVQASPSHPVVERQHRPLE